jgi:hypothetical protein
VPVSPRLRFETVAGCWLERFEAKSPPASVIRARCSRTATSSTATYHRRAGGARSLR